MLVDCSPRRVQVLALHEPADLRPLTPAPQIANLCTGPLHPIHPRRPTGRSNGTHDWKTPVKRSRLANLAGLAVAAVTASLLAPAVTSATAAPNNDPATSNPRGEARAA